MNTLGNLGGLVGPLVVGYAVERWGSWTFPLHHGNRLRLRRLCLAVDRPLAADCSTASFGLGSRCPLGFSDDMN